MASKHRALRISPTLELPLEFLTSTQGILAKKGAGKSHCAQVEAEELLELDQQVVVIDPTGSWSGLRSSADGRSPGYPITIFGGDYGDVPLEATAGAALAEAIVTERFSAVLDLTTMRKGERLRFCADFLETLYRLNREAMHLFIDEADALMPQRPFTPEQARCLGAGDELVRRGRNRGIGVTLISQRAQLVNKDVLSQIDQLVVLRMNHPKDIGAIKDWLADHVEAPTVKEMIASLPALPKGTAWIWSPAGETFQRVAIRAKRTFDSGRTPKAGERRAVPKVLAPVDLARLGETIAATVQRAKDNDPKALRARIAELERSAAKPRADDYRLSELTTKLADAERANEALRSRWNELVAMLERKHEVAVDLAESIAEIYEWAGKQEKAPVVKSPKHAPNGKSARSKPETLANYELNGALSGPERRILGAICWMESIGQPQPSVEAVAFMAGYRPGGGAFNNPRGRLRSKGLVDYPSSGTIALTSAGRAAAPVIEAPRDAEQLHAAVLERLTGPERKLLGPLLDAHPRELTIEELAAQSGYEHGGGAFNNPRGRLRTLGLIDYPQRGTVRAADLLFPEIGK